MIRPAAVDFAIILAVLAVGGALLGPGVLNHDTSWYLVSTSWWLNGLEIYEDILELNPPLAFYLTAPPVFAAEAFGVNGALAMKVYVFAIIAGSLGWSAAVLRRVNAFSAFERRAFVVAAGVGVVIIGMPDFAQRDHLMVVFALPYLTLAMVSGEDSEPSRRARIAIGVFAFLGFGLKHYFLLIPFMATLARCAADRSPRPILSAQNMTIGALCALYVVASYALHPAYFTKVIPLTLQVYGTFTAPLEAVFPRVAMAVFALTIGASFLLALRGVRFRAGLVLCAAGLGAAGSYLIQSKGWTYQAVPAKALAFVAVAWLCAACFAERRHWALRAAAAAFAVVGTLALARPALLAGPYSNGMYARASSHFTCAPGERSYHAFSSNVSVGYPIANFAEAEPAGRAPTMWLFPGAAHRLLIAESEAERARYRALMADARDRALDDFFRVDPQLVIVDVREEKSYFDGAAFDYVSFFSERPEFAAAWLRYEKVDAFEGFEIYRRPGC